MCCVRGCRVTISHRRTLRLHLYECTRSSGSPCVVSVLVESLQVTGGHCVCTGRDALDPEARHVLCSCLPNHYKSLEDNAPAKLRMDPLLRFIMCCVRGCRVTKRLHVSVTRL